jgi:uncharacterized membrane protein
MDEYVVLAGRIAAGLLAGVFFVFAVVIMPAFRGVDDHTFVVSMNRINVSIVNPVFVLIFLGAPVLAVVAAVLDRTPILYVAAALGLTTLLISIAVNIPLNNKLAANLSRENFENVWVLWNAVRSVTAIGSFVCLLLSTAAESLLARELCVSADFLR